MKVMCINNNWYMDPENGKTGISFMRGKIYDTVAPDSGGIESVGDTIVINEQGARHIIKTESGLADFFDQHFRFV